jgi:hypothetical protein
MNSVQTDRSAKDLSLRMLEIINRREFDHLGEVFDEHVITEWPQTGERIRGLQNLKNIFMYYPGGPIATRPEGSEFVEGDEGSYLLTPMFTMVRAEGAGDTATNIVKSTYPDGSDWYVVTVATSRSGKLIRVVQYFGPVYDAPDWRSQWVERME